MDQKLTISVEEYTTPSPLQVGPDVGFDEIVDILKENNIRHLPVVEAGRPIGIISERDVRVLRKHGAEKKPVAREVMTPGPHVIPTDLSLEKAAFDLSQYKIGSALVVNQSGELAGIFTTTDALNALIEVVRGEVEI